MARYYGTVQGARGEASRLGHAHSGIRASVCLWAGRVETSIQAAVTTARATSCTSAPRATAAVTEKGAS